MKNKKIYISGKVTGLLPKETTVKFDTAEELFKKAGYAEIINPKRLCRLFNALRQDGEMTWRECMDVCIEQLVKADTIYMLPDWKDSKGARLEHHIAKELGIHIIYENEDKG